MPMSVRLIQPLDWVIWVIGLKADALTDLLTLMAAGASLNLDLVKPIAKLIRSFI